jgi:PhnO protein
VTQPGHVNVRDASSADAPELTRLLDQLGYHREPDALRDFMRDFMRDDSSHVLVAEVDNELVGLLALSIHAQIHLDLRTASLDAFVVDENQRSAGIGRVMLDAGLRRAHEAGAARIELHSNLRRADAHRFYEREGFEMTSKYFVRPLP